MVAPRNSARKNRATGPVPLRTARGAGRAAGRREEVVLRAAGRFVAAVFFGGVFRALRVVDPEPRPLVLLLFEDVLVLRDPGGEDVRVAMPPNVGDRHTSHRDHTDACR